jgi:hypothetical protein
MSVVSNFYAAKAYSEHPIAIWPLDDDVSYISLITDQQRRFEADSPYAGWTITNGSANDDLPLPDEGSPFSSDIYAGIQGSTPLSDGTIIEAVSPDLFLFSDCNEELKTFCISMYVYQSSNYIKNYEIGYEYYDDDTSSWIEVLSDFTPLERSGWIHLQDTFVIQEFDPDYCRIIFKATVDTGGVSGDYDFIFNGITVGQWSEPYISRSLGANVQPSPVSSGLSLESVSADQYGLLFDYAYYLSERGNLLAKNTGIPMVFGSENVTRLYPSTGGSPSMIFPNKTMFTDFGRYRDFTFETWIKIRPVTKESRKILGPIDTDDGIYVNEGFITLVIDKVFVSHNIYEWYRPMLLHVVIKDEKISMFINGERVGQITVDRESLSLSESDWIGFYSYSDFDVFEIDCVSIFPYAVPLQVARKRFVWGQGTDPIELINDSFDSEEAVIQFSNAKYNNNKIYPDRERWDAGYYNNLVANTNSISVPEYSLPEIYLGGRDRIEWYEDNNIVNNSEYPSGTHPKFFTFRPNQSIRTNLAYNPSVETNTTGWVAFGTGTTISRITTDAKFGNASVQVTKAAVANSGARFATSSGARIPAIPNTTYTLSAWVRVPAGNDPASLRIRWIPSTAVTGGTAVTQLFGSSTTVTPADGWVRLSYTATTTNTTNALAIGVEQGTAGAAGQMFLVDGVLVEQNSHLLPYFDGSYADPTAKAISTSWSGTTNNSVSTMQYWTPEGTNWTEQCYLNFNTMSFLANPISSMYGIFEVEEEINSSRPLIHVVNTLNGKRFEINIDGYEVTYKFDGQELEGTSETVDNSHFVVGFHIPTISQSFNFELASFFGAPELLKVFVGGDGSTTFEGKIYRVGFSDQSNFEEISQHFNPNTGIANYDDDELLEEHYASYTLSPFFRYNTYFLDISVSAQWEEYFPLSSFASYITKRDGSRAYDLDYLQINYGYPSLIEIVETSVDNPDWTYQELFNAFNDPIQKSYEILDNAILSGYSNYADLASNIITEYEIDTSGSSLSSYVTFQLLAEGADEPLSSFTHTKNLTDSYTIYAENENTNTSPYKAYTTKFRIVDGTIIYPPKRIKFENVAMVVHFDIQQDGIISNPLKVRSLEIVARSLNENSLTPIGTRSGMNLYPYLRTGIYYSGKSKNPLLIGKDNLPYLYLTEKTGIRVLETDAVKEYGVLVPINDNKSLNYPLGAVQMFLKYDVMHPISTSQAIFTLEHSGGVIEFLVTPDQTAKRFYLTSRDQRTKQDYSNLVFYQNGIPVEKPYILRNEWNSISFSFKVPLNFSGNSGALSILYGARFNNVSFFKSTGLNEFSVIIPRIWSDILYNDQETDPLNIVDWREWYDEDGALTIPNKWKDIYILDETIEFSITPSNIYSAYCGTNIVVSDDNTGVSLEEDYFTMFADQSWLKITQKPA